MNLKDKLRQALLEAKRVYDYNNVAVILKVDSDEWKEFQSKISDEDISAYETGAGREMNPHITVLYGIHTDVPDKDVEDLIETIKEPLIEFGSITSFTNDDFDVLKFDIESSDLVKLNKLFKKLPHTCQFPNYHPHCTIAYLKKGTAKKYIKEFSGVKLTNPEIKNFIYSKSDGTKKNYNLQ